MTHLKRMARAAAMAKQCPAEHCVNDPARGGKCIFYCQLKLGHDGRHIDMAGRDWKRMFLGSVRGIGSFKPSRKKKRRGRKQAPKPKAKPKKGKS